jgi:uncharacterized protein (TIGR02466 family)
LNISNGNLFFKTERASPPHPATSCHPKVGKIVQDFFQARTYFGVMNHVAASSQPSTSFSASSTPVDAPAASHVPLFATPLSMYESPGMDEVNRDVTSLLIEESRSVPSVRRSNVGGWHSRADLAMRPDPCFRSLIQYIVSRVRETVDGLAREREQGMPAMRIGVHAWAMVMRSGDYTIAHDHADAHWSTVYYPDAGDADEATFPDSGLLALVDSRHGGRPMPGLDLLGSTFTARPSTGRLLVFPGWLLHYVNVYRGQRPRVAVSCNVTFELAPPR